MCSKILERGDSCHSRYQSLEDLFSLDSSTSRTATCFWELGALPSLRSTLFHASWDQSRDGWTIPPCNLNSIIPVSSGESSWDACHGKVLVGAKSLKKMPYIVWSHVISPHIAFDSVIHWCQTYIEQFNDGRSFHFITSLFSSSLQ